MASIDFSNVKHQIGYCGIWCGSCVVGNGVLMEMASRYRAMLEAYDLGEWGPKDLDYDEFIRGLRSIQAMDRCPGCLKGGGRDACEIRACARAKDLADCDECHDGGACSHVEILRHMRSGARKAGLLVKAGEADREALLMRWTTDIASKWPFSLLFEEAAGSSGEPSP